MIIRKTKIYLLLRKGDRMVDLCLQSNAYLINQVHSNNHKQYVCACARATIKVTNLDLYYRLLFWREQLPLCILYFTVEYGRRLTTSNLRRLAYTNLFFCCLPGTGQQTTMNNSGTVYSDGHMPSEDRITQTFATNANGNLILDVYKRQLQHLSLSRGPQSSNLRQNL